MSCKTSHRHNEKRNVYQSNIKRLSTIKVCGESGWIVSNIYSQLNLNKKYNKEM